MITPADNYDMEFFMDESGFLRSYREIVQYASLGYISTFYKVEIKPWVISMMFFPKTGLEDKQGCDIVGESLLKQKIRLADKFQIDEGRFYIHPKITPKQYFLMKMMPSNRTSIDYFSLYCDNYLRMRQVASLISEYDIELDVKERCKILERKLLIEKEVLNSFLPSTTTLMNPTHHYEF